MRKNNSNTAHAGRRKRYYNVAIKKLPLDGRAATLLEQLRKEG